MPPVSGTYHLHSVNAQLKKPRSGLLVVGKKTFIQMRSTNVFIRKVSPNLNQLVQIDHVHPLFLQVRAYILSRKWCHLDWMDLELVDLPLGQDMAAGVSLFSLAYHIRRVARGFVDLSVMRPALQGEQTSIRGFDQGSQYFYGIITCRNHMTRFLVLKTSGHHSDCPSSVILLQHPGNISHLV